MFLFFFQREREDLILPCHHFNYTHLLIKICVFLYLCICVYVLYLGDALPPFQLYSKLFNVCQPIQVTPYCPFILGVLMFRQ